MDIRDIMRKLKPLRRRMHVNTGLRCFMACLCAGGVTATVLAFASLWVPVPFLLRSILYVYFASAAVGIIISVISAPGTKNLIETADALGLKERLATAWQLRGEESVIARLQRQDAIMMVSTADFRSLYPIRFPAKLALVLVISLILTSSAFMLPTYARDSAKKIEKLQNVVDEQLEKLEKVQDEIKNNNNMKEAELEKIMEEAARLAEDLKKARTEEEALKAVSRAENELERLDLQEQLNKLGEALSRNDMTSDLGDAVQDGNMTDMKQAIEQLKQQLEQKEISPAELADMLEQAAEQLENKEMSEQLSKAAEALASESLEEQNGALDNLDDALSEMMQSPGSSGLGEAMGQLSQALQQAKSNISMVDSNLTAAGENSSGAAGQSSGKVSGQQAMQGGGQGSGSAAQTGRPAGAGQGAQGSEQSTGEGGNAGAGQNQGAGGSGQGAGQGQGSGQGQNGGGGGAGKGSTNEDSGYTGSEQSGGGREGGSGYEEEYEQLYDPDHLGGNADPSYVTGHKQGGGQSSYSDADHIPVEKGAILPYNEVLARSSSEAAAYMEETEIPAAMKEIVREYFESLE